MKDMRLLDTSTDVMIDRQGNLHGTPEAIENLQKLMAVRPWLLSDVVKSTDSAVK